MQRIQLPKNLVQRTAQAQRNWERKQKKLAKYTNAEERTARFREQRGQLDEFNEDVKVARLARKEQWEQGPLAPRRDIFNTWGATEANRQNRQSALTRKEVNKRCAWAGGVPFLNLSVKDRVVVLEGPEKGKIDRIASINKQDGTVTLENICRITTKTPDRFQTALEAPATQNVALSIPISAIRLVHPVKDPKTGVARDVVIRQLARGPVDTIRHTGTLRWTRYVPGDNIAIPWPQRDKQLYEEQACDTKIRDVDAVTFVPTLLRPPMPTAVIDELRNKFSVFRTRHEDWYVEKYIEKERAKKAGDKGDPASMRTALQELNLQQRQERKAKGKPRLSEEMLEKIGEVIARNKARTMNGSGISAVESAPVSSPTPTESSHPPLQ